MAESHLVLGPAMPIGETVSYAEWVASNFSGLRLLGASTSQFRPGEILKHDTNQYIANAELLYETWVPGQPLPTNFWEAVQDEAFIAGRSFSETREQGFNLKIPGLISINLGSARHLEATFSAEALQARYFIAAELPLLIPVFRRLRAAHPEAYEREIDGNLLVLETRYASKATLQFKRGGNVVAKAEVERLGTISAGGEMKWDEEHTLTATGAVNVPFGVVVHRL